MFLKWKNGKVKKITGKRGWRLDLVGNQGEM